MPNSLYQSLVDQAHRQPAAVAWIELDQQTGPAANGDIHTAPEPRYVSWESILDRVNRLAYWFEQQALQPRDRIVNLGVNSLDWVVVDLACQAIGCIHAPIDHRRGAKDLQLCIAKLEPRLVLKNPRTELTQVGTQKPSGSVQDRWLCADRSEETATILWTSGTSSQPKGVMLSHSNLVSNAQAKLDAMPQYASDLRLNLLPFSHAYARTCELTTWILSGSTLCTAGTSKDFIKIARQIRPTLINAVPSLYHNWWQVWNEQLSSLTEQASLAGQASVTKTRSNSDSETPSDRNQSTLRGFLGGNIRQLASGGAAIPKRLRDQFAARGLLIYQGYGLTEASPVVCSNRAVGSDGKPILEGVGPPVKGVQCRVEKDGQLALRSPGVMQGYWRDEKATSERIRDGWLLTGDSIEATNLLESNLLESALFDSNSALHISGRIDDLQVLSNGTKFAPLPLESKIERIDEIEKAVLIGGDRPRPLLVLRLVPGAQVSRLDLLDRVAKELADEPHHLHPLELTISNEPWTTENGLKHWKGAVNRREIERRFAGDAQRRLQSERSAGRPAATKEPTQE
jgi:long-chain acyl-CoA synthetase